MPINAIIGTCDRSILSNLGRTMATAAAITISDPIVRSSVRRNELMSSSSSVREMLALNPHSEAAVTTSE
jgi:hypothetical protein